MKNISIRLENCYGIREFNEQLSFEKSNANLIYAPNGVMKTSLAKTFLRISNGDEPEEKLHGRIPNYEIKIDETPILPEQILVIRPFDTDYESKNISTLLVNTEKKLKYDTAYKEILDSKKKAITKLNKLSKIKGDEIEAKISQDLGVSNIFEAIKLLQTTTVETTNLDDVKYAEIFDDKVIDLLKNDEIKSGIYEYTNRYNELLEKSPIYSKGKFNPANADAVSKTLKKERFFEASHKIFLNGSENPVAQQADFEKTLEQAHSEVLNDKTLQSIHKQLLAGVAAVKTFQSVLERVPSISSLLADLSGLRKKLWAAYYASAQAEFDSLINLYEARKGELTAIELEAQQEETLWHKAKETFKTRFHVPFDIEVENQTNTILGTTAPNMVFTFKGEDGQNLRFNRGQLHSMDVLSVGERRAMYLLYVIFEFIARINIGAETIVIIDDIADSFDYKNKFAIIEYLKELSQETPLRLIILTHNFDFYRTIQGRILGEAAKRNNSYVAQRSGDKIILLKGGSDGISNPFKLWKKDYKTNPAMLISLIPFIRNIIEYKEGTKSVNYLTLTSMLHLKDETVNLKTEHLIEIMTDVLKDAATPETIDSEKSIVDLIYETADHLCSIANDNEISLENKITLSIAARLKAEEFMLARVVDKTTISGNQTTKLFERLKKEDLTDAFKNQKKLLSQVILMTPENIHLNSFMYEPLMDMSVLHLVDLYKNLKNLY